MSQLAIMEPKARLFKGGAVYTSLLETILSTTATATSMAAMLSSCLGATVTRAATRCLGVVVRGLLNVERLMTYCNVITELRAFGSLPT